MEQQMTDPIDASMPFFERIGDMLRATEAARGPWTANSLHGRVIIGLLGAEIERLHGGPEYHPARLTVDMYRAPQLVEFEVITRVVRDGHRIKVVDAELLADGQSAGRATCQLLRKTDEPEGEVWNGGGNWEVPAPDDLEPVPPSPLTMDGMWDMRFISGPFHQPGQRRVWMREIRPLVGGEPLTPFARVAVGCDYISPMSNLGSAGLKYINSDVTLYLHRAPIGDWIGYETAAHDATHGVAIGHCHIYDEQGRIGWGSVCALGQTITPSGTPRR